jgi:hypothetical protein
MRDALRKHALGVLMVLCLAALLAIMLTMRSHASMGARTPTPAAHQLYLPIVIHRESDSTTHE